MPRLLALASAVAAASAAPAGPGVLVPGNLCNVPMIQVPSVQRFEMQPYGEKEVHPFDDRSDYIGVWLKFIAPQDACVDITLCDVSTDPNDLMIFMWKERKYVGDQTCCPTYYDLRYQNDNYGDDALFLHNNDVSPGRIYYVKVVVPSEYYEKHGKTGDPHLTISGRIFLSSGCEGGSLSDDYDLVERTRTAAEPSCASLSTMPIPPTAAAAAITMTGETTAPSSSLLATLDLAGLQANLMNETSFDYYT